jgi:hypothetical protein
VGEVIFNLLKLALVVASICFLVFGFGYLFASGALIAVREYMLEKD